MLRRDPIGYELTDLIEIYETEILTEELRESLTEYEIEEKMGRWICKHFEPCDITGLYYPL